MVIVTRSSSASIASSTAASSTVASSSAAGTAAVAQPTSVNIALYGKATASNSRPDSPPTGVNDGKTGTLGLNGWMTALNTLPQWVRLDFSNPVSSISPSFPPSPIRELTFFDPLSTS